VVLYQAGVRVDIFLFFCLFVVVFYFPTFFKKNLFACSIFGFFFCVCVRVCAPLCARIPMCWCVDVGVSIHRFFLLYLLFDIGVSAVCYRGLDQGF
jgi:hypothetical protein